MIEGGFIQLSRTLLDSEIFRDKPAVWLKIWIYILFKMSYVTDNTRVRGSKFISSKHIMASTGATRSQVFSSLKWMQSVDMISLRNQPRGNIITVCNYDTYQDISNYKAARDRHEIDTPSTLGKQSVDTTSTVDSDTIIKKKKNKKEKEEENIYTPENQNHEYANRIQDIPLEQSNDASKIIDAFAQKYNRSSAAIRSTDIASVGEYLSVYGFDWCMNAILNQRRTTMKAHFFEQTKEDKARPKTEYRADFEEDAKRDEERRLEREAEKNKPQMTQRPDGVWCVLKEYD